MILAFYTYERVIINICIESESLCVSFVLPGLSRLVDRFNETWKWSLKTKQNSKTISSKINLFQKQNDSALVDAWSWSSRSQSSGHWTVSGLNSRLGQCNLACVPAWWLPAGPQANATYLNQLQKLRFRVSYSRLLLIAPGFKVISYWYITTSKKYWIHHAAKKNMKRLNAPNQHFYHYAWTNSIVESAYQDIFLNICAQTRHQALETVCARENSCVSMKLQ